MTMALLWCSTRRIVPFDRVSGIAAAGSNRPSVELRPELQHDREPDCSDMTNRSPMNSLQHRLPTSPTGNATIASRRTSRIEDET